MTLGGTGRGCGILRSLGKTTLPDTFTHDFETTARGAGATAEVGTGSGSGEDARTGRGGVACGCSVCAPASPKAAPPASTITATTAASFAPMPCFTTAAASAVVTGDGELVSAGVAARADAESEPAKRPAASVTPRRANRERNNSLPRS